MQDNDVLRFSVSVDPVKDGKFVFPGLQANYSLVLDGGILKLEDWDSMPELIRALLRSVGVAP